MKKIASFTIDHCRLIPGIYLSRVDTTPSGDVISTFDIRMTAPNRQPALSVSALHTIEHLAATFLRNHPIWSDRVVYWGPMGCCTGNYLLLQGKLKSVDIVDLVKETFLFISNFEGEVPGASARDCGNYLLMNLPEAKYVAKAFLELLETDNFGLEYPES